MSTLVKANKSKCQGVTKKGEACKRCATAGQPFCSSHAPKGGNQKQIIKALDDTSEPKKALNILLESKEELLIALNDWLVQHKDTDYAYPHPMVLSTECKIYVVGSDHQLVQSRFTHLIDDIFILAKEHKATSEDMTIISVKRFYDERDHLEPLSTMNVAYLRLLKRTGMVIDDYNLLDEK